MYKSERERERERAMKRRQRKQARGATPGRRCERSFVYAALLDTYELLMSVYACLHTGVCAGDYALASDRVCKYV